MLILDEHKYPSAVGLESHEVKHHKPILTAIRSVGQNRFDFEYAIDKLLQEKDTDKISAKDFNEAFDEDRVFNLIQKHKVIILMGSRLCDRILGKKLKKANGKVHKIGGRVFIPIYSSFYLHKNRKKCNIEFKLAHAYYTGDFIERDFCTHEIVDTLDRLAEIIQYRKITGIVSFDFETTGLEYYDDDVVATVLALTFQPGHSYVVPIDHIEHDWDDPIRLIELLNILMSDDEVIKVAHNFVFDWHFMRKYGITIKGRKVDTMLMHHLLDENKNHGLKGLVAEYFPFWAGYEDGVDFFGPLDQLSKYAAVDADVTLQLYYIFERQLREPDNSKLYTLLRNLVMPAVEAIQEMEWNGCYINRDLIYESIEKANRFLEMKESQW